MSVRETLRRGREVPLSAHLAPPVTVALAEAMLFVDPDLPDVRIGADAALRVLWLDVRNALEDLS